MLTGPVPFWLKAPSRLMRLAPVPVTRPLLVMVNPPPFVVVIDPLLIKVLPTREMPVAVLVFKLPCNVDVPVAPCNDMLAAEIDC